ncbi:MAG: L,D-transpeptidase [Acidimicrobiia bacterium]
MGRNPPITSIVMRFGLSSMAATLVVAGCGGGGEPETSVPSTVPIPVVAPIADDPPTGEQVLDQRPVWGGFEATSADPVSLAAYARGELEVFGAPDQPEPTMTVEEETILGTVTVLGVVTGPVDGWVEVMLPTRPNGSTGWLRASEVDFYVADSEIVVDLGARRLTYFVDGVAVLSTEVGVGSKYNQTPIGEFFVTDSVALTNPNGPWGPHALGLSARSETITGFNGGDGIIGIHGTNNPSSIGGNISLGCVRLPNEMITLLYEMVPLGTRVLINA